MGCCESREDKKEKFFPKFKKAVRSTASSRDLYARSLEDQDLIAIPENSPASRKQKQWEDSNSLILYLEWCRSSKKWSELSQLTSDNTEISEPPVYLIWASKPSTIGSLAVVYLCLEIKKSPKEVIGSVESVVKDLMFQLPLKPPDFQENMMLLLFFFLNNVKENTVKILVKFGMFGIINRFLMNERQEMIHLTLSVCWKIYREREYAQESFLNYNGGFKLVALVKEEGFGNEFLRTLVSAITDLICCSDGSRNVKNVQRVNVDLLWEEIRKIDKGKLEVDILEKIDFLIGFLDTEIAVKP